jgi:hypothetical protein
MDNKYIIQKTKWLEDMLPAFVVNCRLNGDDVVYDLPSKYERDDAISLIKQLELNIQPYGELSCMFSINTCTNTNILDDLFENVFLAMRSCLR